jgi:hypothetical protein
VQIMIFLKQMMSGEREPPRSATGLTIEQAQSKEREGLESFERTLLDLRSKTKAPKG